MGDRPATPEDIGAICGSLPEVELGIAWRRPAYKVPGGGKGRWFLLYRPPQKSVVDPATGNPFDDLLVVLVPDADTKAALVEDPALPFFTIPHFDGHNSVLVQQSRLHELERDRLEEILVEAWASVAPDELVRTYLHARGVA